MIVQNEANKARADRAQRLLRRRNLVKVLADIRHLCDAEGISFAYLNRLAEAAYQAQTFRMVVKP